MELTPETDKLPVVTFVKKYENQNKKMKIEEEK